MRTKAIIFFLAAVAVAAFMMLCLRQTPPAAKPLVEAKVSAPLAPPHPRFIPSNHAKMAAISVPSGTKQASFNPTMDSWADVQLILNDGADFHKRLAAIGRLSSTLTDADWKILRGFLLKSDALDNDQLGQVLKNTLMDKLCEMNPPPAGLDVVFAQMYEDLAQNEVLRDYALQHLATFDELLAGQTGANILREETADQKVLWNALLETGNSIAGTALLGLERLSQAGEQVDQDRLSGMALEMANDPTAGELTLSTAYQVCAARNEQQALPTIEAAAQSGQTVSLQISAIGALGVIGGASIIPLLQNLLQGNDERLKLPAKAAINRIEQRLQLQASVK